MLPTQEHDAFCETCPTPEEVTKHLQSLGFRLVFQMEAVRYPAYTPTPDLPAQFHYRDEYGTEVIFLAGQDTGLDGEHLPRHRSRFWITPGWALLAFQHAANSLALLWSLSWQLERKTSPSSTYAA